MLHSTAHTLQFLPRLGIPFQTEENGIALGHAHSRHVDAAGLQRVDEGAEVGAGRAIVTTAGLEN